MKKLFLILFLAFSVQAFSQMKVTGNVTLKGTTWTDIHVTLGVSTIDLRSGVAYMPIYFYKDIQSLAGSEENRIAEAYFSVKFNTQYPDCEFIEEALKDYLVIYFTVDKSRIITLSFCE